MISKRNQISLFDMLDDSSFVKITDGKKYNKDKIELPTSVVERLNKYTLDDYIYDVEHLGLEKTWDYICQFVLDCNCNTISQFESHNKNFLNINNFGELYEIGLATQDKVLKKKSGQYYTPDDVASVMSQWLFESDGEAVCDVACGTGKLILTYLDLIGYESARQLISSGNLYLYDFDNVALKICITTIAIKYGLDIADSINDIFCDFLDRSIKLPDNCKVISNPPYARINDVQGYWEHTDVLMDTKELYSSFMEKIFSQAKSTVIITPFSFISGTKFYSLRQKMCSLGNGFIVAFDNVPGNIFCGRKHGIFNTNTANSVRAAITVLNKSDIKGFKVSPLLRFKNEERKELLQSTVLKDTLPNNFQVVDENKTSFEKVGKDLTDVFEKWNTKSSYTVKSIRSKSETDYLIDMPNTCRYFTTASSKKLSRTGSITLYVENEKIFDFLYCFINSSFTYFWWRVYDGGITYPVSLLNDMPLPFNLISADDEKFFREMALKLKSIEEESKITKVNAGVVQENIKFPEELRNAINARLLKIIGSKCDSSVFKRIHANRFFEEE